MDKLKLKGAEISTLGVGVALLCYAIALVTKTVQIKVENSARKTIRLSTVRFCAPRTIERKKSL